MTIVFALKVELRELSLTEADADREARKPFWEGIQLTGRDTVKFNESHKADNCEIGASGRQ
jgi:hypothetical protein